MRMLLIAAAVAALPLGGFAGITTASASEKPLARFSTKTKLGELMDNRMTMAILKKHIPGVMADPEIAKGRKYSLRFLSGFDKRIKTALPAIDRDLAALR